MKNAIIAAIVACCLAGCDPRYSGGPGDRVETAIVIRGATGETDGVHAEYAYVRENLPGWRPKGQGLVTSGDRIYDRMDLVDGTGANRTIYFDITSWLGKGMGF